MGDEKSLSIITHKGEWVIDEEKNISIECYVTNDRRRILSLRGTARAIGLTGGGSNALVRNMGSKYLQPYLSKELIEWKTKIENGEVEKIQGNDGTSFIPFDGDLFVDICKAYIKAKQDGILNPQQSLTADRLLGIMSAFAKTGIIALIDEITGFDKERERDELQQVLAKYIRKEHLPWTSRFPEEFYEEIYRLRGWKYNNQFRTPYVGKLTNQIVYEVLPPKVLEELQNNNPVVYNNGARRYKHHQFLTVDTGVPHLDKHLVAVITLMRACDDWNEFERLFNKSFKKDEK